MQRIRRSLLAAFGVAGGVAAVALTRRRRGTIEIQRSITVEKPRDETYSRWRDPATQPLVWRHFAEVTDSTADGAHWRAELPLGRTLEWDSQIVDDRSGEQIRWQSTGDLPNEGAVEFRDAPREHGTEITIRMRFDPPGGPLGEVAARWFDDAPKLVLAKALRRFKSLVESGEIPSTERQPSARAG